MSEATLPVDYSALLGEIKERIRAAQLEALRSVNRELVALYWDIGRMIAEKQRTANWGDGVVRQLASDLRKEFPGVGGFSVQNLWYMRQFHLAYHGHEKLQPLVGEITVVSRESVSTMMNCLPTPCKGTWASASASTTAHAAAQGG